MKVPFWSMVSCSSFNDTLNHTSFHHSRKLTDHHNMYWPVWAYACPHVHQTHWWVVQWDLMDHWLSQLLSPILFGYQTKMTSSPLTSSRSAGCVESLLSYHFFFPYTKVLQCASIQVPAVWPWTSGQLTRHTALLFSLKETIAEDANMTPCSASQKKTKRKWKKKQIETQ